DHIGEVMHRRIALAGADRLDQHDIEAERLQQAHHEVEVIGNGTVPRDGGQAADEDAVIVGAAGHTEAVAEEGTAAQWTLRSAGEDGGVRAAGADVLDQLADEGPLADAAAAGDRDDAGGVLGWS